MATINQDLYLILPFSHRPHHFSAILCTETVKYVNTIQYDTIRYDTIQYNTIQYNTIQCNAMQCNAMQCNAMQCNAMQCNAIQYNTIQYTITVLSHKRDICVQRSNKKSVYENMLGAGPVILERGFMHLNTMRDTPFHAVSLIF